MGKTRVLFAVLDWGLGHATRSAPIINALIADQCEVIIAGSGRSLRWLQQRFPELTCIEKPAADIRYSRYLNGVRIASQAPAFLRSINRERMFTEQVVHAHAIERIYSDNCYGVYHADCPSVLITHQLNLPVMKGLRPLAGWLMCRLLRHFNEIWVPDTAAFPGLSGKLGHADYKLPICHIGWRSQYTLVDALPPNKHVPLVALISGPEPHRSLFERQVAQRFRASGRQAVLFCGTAEEHLRTEGMLTFYGNASAATIKGHLLQAETIVCRSGYSTLMDLHLMGVADRVEKWVPTPGQWEQEYLAKLHNRETK
jgi:hypothetical protein